MILRTLCKPHKTGHPIEVSNQAGCSKTELVLGIKESYPGSRTLETALETENTREEKEERLGGGGI